MTAVSASSVLETLNWNLNCSFSIFRQKANRYESSKVSIAWTWEELVMAVGLSTLERIIRGLISNFSNPFEKEYESLQNEIDIFRRIDFYLLFTKLFRFYNFLFFFSSRDYVLRLFLGVWEHALERGWKFWEFIRICFTLRSLANRLWLCHKCLFCRFLLNWLLFGLDQIKFRRHAASGFSAIRWVSKNNFVLNRIKVFRSMKTINFSAC